MFVVSAIALVWCMRARARQNPAALWLCGWSFLLLSGLGLHADPGWGLIVAALGGTLFPVLLLAGALTYGEKPLPGWLIPSGMGIAVARAAGVATGHADLSHAAGILLEPAAELAAAWAMLPLFTRDGTTFAQRSLAPLFALMALLDGAGGVSALAGDPLPPILLWSWAVATPPTVAAQIGASAQRLLEQQVALRAELERRVSERTSQLASANHSLETEVEGRRRAEQRLRASQRRYRTVSELSSDLSFAFRMTPDGGLESDWVTDAFTRITGYTPEQFAKIPWQRLVHPEDLETVSAHHAAAMRGERREFEARIVRRDGEVRWLQTTLQGVHSAEDGVLRLVGATRDVTDRKRAEEEWRSLESHIRERQRLESLGVLAGGLAHDFNNVLAVVLGNSALARAELPEGSPVAARLERIRSAAQHAAGLTDQMLTYSGNASVTLKPLDLSRLLESVQELLEASLTRRGRLELRLSGEPTLVEGDETQLRQVAVNLISNAAEAMGDRPGTVWVRTGNMTADAAYLADTFGPSELPEGRYVYLEVTDSGAGIDEATRARIFEPFYTTKRSGRGLGLAAVLGIVQGHHGAIKLSSEPGRGTSIRVLLPSSGRTEPLRSASSGSAGRSEGGTVLVVDDDDLVLELAQEFLERAGYEVITAGGGREALERVADGSRIDVVLLDVLMPDLGGEEVLRSLRRDRPEIPVILATGFGDETTLRH
ncbi:MAG: ATP-binding protein, partial [Myxococcota bacterium]